MHEVPPWNAPHSQRTSFIAPMASAVHPEIASGMPSVLGGGEQVLRPGGSNVRLGADGVPYRQGGHPSKAHRAAVPQRADFQEASTRPVIVTHNPVVAGEQVRRECFLLLKSHVRVQWQ